KGEDYYLSFLPPSMQEMESPPEFIIQQMAHAGIDRVVLQNAHPYGRLEEYFADAVSRYPDKFIPLAGVDETRASEADEIRRLRVSVKELGMRGLYYANRGLFLEGHRRSFDDESFEPFWHEVETLGIPVFWEMGAVPEPTPPMLLREIDRLNRWAERHPTVPCLYTHGLAPDLLEGNTPEPVGRLLENEQFMIELLYPIHWARDHQYPFPELRPVLRTLYDAVGSERLAWGSDMPNVERNCTYKQSLQYIHPGFDFLPSSDIDRILGKNVLRLLKLS
ncbi:MAG TPA: amidohydrolase family protein, partial [Chloroflexota bacterium]|nr:amidohydrolase family protein [Chloroflexota bacterium]